MAGSKRMSAEEKRKAILKIYHTTKQVYTEKEILALATKAGVNPNTAPDINQSLIDDNLVSKEKIGGSNYFWSFPGKNDFLLQKKHESILAENQTLQIQITESSNRLADAKRGREENDGERPKRLQKLNELTAKKTTLEAEREKLKGLDPSALKDLEKEWKLCKQSADRWTDNVFECKSYLVKKRMMARKEANKILGINDDFDYPDDKK